MTSDEFGDRERERSFKMGMRYYPSWSTAGKELAVIRAAFHAAVHALVSGELLPSWVHATDEQDVRDYFVAQARNGKREPQP